MGTKHNKTQSNSSKYKYLNEEQTIWANIFELLSKSREECEKGSFGLKSKTFEEN